MSFDEQSTVGIKTVFHMIVDENNIASIKGIEKLIFKGAGVLGE